VHCRFYLIKYEIFCINIILNSKIKAVLLTGSGGLQSCETSTAPLFLGNRLGEVVSLTRRQRFGPQENSWQLFLLEAE
jgi:hypothetical protein